MAKKYTTKRIPGHRKKRERKPTEKQLRKKRMQEYYTQSAIRREAEVGRACAAIKAKMKPVKEGTVRP